MAETEKSPPVTSRTRSFKMIPARFWEAMQEKATGISGTNSRDATSQSSSRLVISSPLAVHKLPTSAGPGSPLPPPSLASLRKGSAICLTHTSEDMQIGTGSDTCDIGRQRFEVELLTQTDRAAVTSATTEATSGSEPSTPFSERKKRFMGASGPLGSFTSSRSRANSTPLDMPRSIGKRADTSVSAPSSPSLSPAGKRNLGNVGHSPLGASEPQLCRAASSPSEGDSPPESETKPRTGFRQAFLRRQTERELQSSPDKNQEDTVDSCTDVNKVEGVLAEIKTAPLIDGSAYGIIKIRLLGPGKVRTMEHNNIMKLRRRAEGNVAND